MLWCFMFDEIRRTAFSSVSEDLPVADIQVLGFGIAGLGLAVAADRMGLLSKLLRSGLIFMDKRAISDFNSLRFDIDSNSPANDFLSGVSDKGIFADVLTSAEGDRLRDRATKILPLSYVADFFRAMALRLQQEISLYPRSEFISGRELATLKILSGNKLLSLDGADRPIAVSRAAILALGAKEVPKKSIVDVAKAYRAHFMCSENILRGQQSAFINKTLSSGRKIAVVGGSHSAFSVVEYLLRRFGQNISDAQILLVRRSPIKVFHSCVTDFERDTCGDEGCLVDPETGEVNRFSGLRGEAKATYLSVWKTLEKRVKITDFSSFRLASSRLSDSQIGMVVQATGYAHNFPVIKDGDGTLCPDVRHQAVALSEDHSLVADNRTRGVKQIYGLGLGCFSPGQAPFCDTGEVPVGVNIYHQQHASIVLNHIIKAGEIDERSTLQARTIRVAGNEV